MKSSLLQLVIGIGAVAAFASCSRFVAPSSYEEVQKESYKTSFETKYGAIPSNQKWDFSTYEVRLGTRGGSGITTEIMEKGVDFGDVSNLELEHHAFPQKPVWDYDIIKSGITKTSSSFYIYPLLSGGGNRYDLKVKVGDEDPVIVFTKDYTNFQTVNGMKKLNGETVNMRGLKIEAPVGTPIEIYLDNMIDVDNKKLPTMGTTNGYAVYIDVPEDVQLELDDVELADDHVIKYIGIEDAQNGDFDYNDLVLAVVGNPDVPQDKIITNNQYVVNTCRAKRYMIEDLGSIGDFDFNDVVVDVEEKAVITHEVTYENGIKKTDKIISQVYEPTKAVIRAMGGTIDFELTIGTTSWTKSGAGFEAGTMYNTQGTIDYDKVLAEFEVNDWDPVANNVSITVNGQNGEVYTITFPKAGTAPMIIAVDPTQKWMPERESVPSSWFYIPE